MANRLKADGQASMRHWLKWIIPLAIGAAVSGCTEVRSFFKQDACLDRGGRWDAMHDRCIEQATQSYPEQPHQWPVISMSEKERNNIVLQLKQLKVGDSRVHIVALLGRPFDYQPLDKDMDGEPGVRGKITYCFFSNEGGGLCGKNGQQLVLLLDGQDRLVALMYHDVPGLTQMTLNVPVRAFVWP